MYIIHNQRFKKKKQLVQVDGVGYWDIGFKIVKSDNQTNYHRF